MIKESDVLQFDSQITGIKEANTCDESLYLFAVSFESKVVLIKSDDGISKVAEIPFHGPIIDIFGIDWNFVLAVGENDSLKLLTINESGDCIENKVVKFDTNVKSLSFISPKHIAVLLNNTIAMIHVSGEKCGNIKTKNINFSDISGIDNKIYLSPYYKCTFENWNYHLLKLLKDDKYMEAIQGALLMYTDKLILYNCEGYKNEIRDFLKDILTKYLLMTKEPLNIQFVAKSAVTVELGEFMISEFIDQINDPLKEQLFIISMLEASADKPDLTPSVVRLIHKIKNVDKTVMEDILLKMSFPHSFIQELIRISREYHFNRLLFQNFNRIYENIFPVFSYIIDTGNQEDISFACKYVFLSNKFEIEKTNICIIWLFSPDYHRLHKCFEANWSIATDFIQQILGQAPIKFSPTQSLNKNEIVSVSFICFEGAPLGKADNLFTLLASEALENDILIPCASINTVMSFIFKSSSPRAIREKLFLRIVNNDYKDQISLSNHSGLCISSGFSNAVKQIYNDSNDIEPYVTSLLLSDEPNKAFSIIEDTTLPRDSIKHTICMRFLPLLFLDSDRFVNLIIKHFPELHPSYINSIENPNVKMVYYESLFLCNDYSNIADYKFYLEYLANYSITRFITFLRGSKHVIPEEEVFEYCKEKKLYIGSAVLYSRNEKWNDAYNSYLLHLNNGGKYDSSITLELITNINKINEEPSQILRSLLQPIVEVSEDTSKLVNLIIQKTTQEISQSDILLGILPPAVSCSNPRIKSTLFKFINKAAFCCSVDSNNSQNFIPKLNEIINYCKGKCISNNKITLLDDKDGLTVLSTLQERKGEQMSEELFSDTCSILQRIESIFVSHGKRVAQDEESNVVLVLNN